MNRTGVSIPSLVSLAGLFVVTAVALRIEGRVWWCEAGDRLPWSWDVWSRHCSQHLIDPYGLSHVCHGLVFWAVLRLVAPKWALGWKLVASVAVASGWEILENSPIIIERYRSATMSLDYMGDSVVNALGDLLCCMAGFLVAQRVKMWWTLLIFVALEVISLLWIRDNLCLNVVMLISPIEAVKQWQVGGAG